MTRELPTIRGTRPGAAPAGYVFREYVWNGTVQPPKRGPSFKPVKLCSLDGCERRVHGRGMCSAHYHKALRGLELEFDNRRKPFDPSRCGTLGGYSRHRTHGIPICQPCRDAKNKYDRERKARVKEARNASSDS